MESKCHQATRQQWQSLVRLHLEEEEDKEEEEEEEEENCGCNPPWMP